ncbi:MAG TPA: pitrilysin family protein [Vicinamibacterales bacterium]|jgi:predicted Zn-dependent peptidase|nr:pitrilysin family protein [Vicinamibacterales bacterium]
MTPQTRIARLAGRAAAAGLALTLVAMAPVEAQQQAPDRSKPPELGPAPSLKVPPITKRALSNGLPVWIVEMHEVPVVDLTMIVKSGASSDPAGKYGVASFTAAMLDEGAGTRDALAIADAIDYLGATLTTSSAFDASSVHLHGLASKIDAALPIFADVVRRPTFPQADMERLRTERLTTLLQFRDNPQQLAASAFSRILYGPQHRYGTGTIGTETTNKALTVADLRQFYTASYRPQNAHLLVVGDVTAASILPKLERAFGTWAAPGDVARPVLPAVPAPTTRRIFLIDKPGAAQSQIRMGTIGVARSTPDYHTIDVLNTLLGGSFTSRLNMNLREEHGYSYGAGSAFDMRQTPGPFFAAAGVQTDKTVESLTEFFKEIDGVREPVSDEELARAKSLEALSFPGTFETTSDMAAQLATLIVYKLPDTFFDEYVPKIQAVTTADLQRVATQRLNSQTFVVVVAGDLAKIEQPIRNANFGAVTIVNADDILR